MIRPALSPAPPLDCAPRGVDGSRTPGLEPLRTIVPRVLARLCLTCDGHAADASHHCTRCGAEVDAESYPELVS